MNSIRHHNKIIIGGSLEALAYAAKHNTPVVFVEPVVPPFYEEMEGVSKKELWKKLSFLLSMSGLLLGGDNVTSLRLEGNDILKIITRNNGLFKCAFEELLVFDANKVEGLPLKKEKQEFQVLDWFNVRSGMKHEHEVIQDTESSFVNKIYFYQSERIDGNHNKKDLVAVSFMNKEQVDSPDYSDIYARFKVLNMMKEAGIRGTRNGRDQNDKTKFKYYAIKVESTEREIIDMSKIYLEENFENIRIVDKGKIDLDNALLVSENKYFNKIKTALRV
jgi:hypothetical protein